jgi:molybdopterin-guanine dinucleotide biosynthesis protein A
MKQPAESYVPPLIILAGGRSERFGSPKGLALFEGESLIFSHILSYGPTGTAVIIVLGYYTTPYIAEIERAKSQMSEKKIYIDYVINEKFDLGPFSSIQTGLTKLGALSANGVFIQPVDSGVVSSEIFESLYHMSQQGSFTVVPEFDGKGGHPVFVSKTQVTRLMSVDPCSEMARLDYQIRSEPSGQVKRIAVGSRAILENRNFPT